ncbi:hypothetical protein HYALB_00003895 [Hymenoscyphus albidus]|uniref:L-dopachrome isomerase n=1 Tax=Hymenoscyphus albidus TaxID=595503 RepID=A0A9N9Q948_9HELO|nr:hypothetical protein HYALB_00003895 [Hymenoscyphus albidus]
MPNSVSSSERSSSPNSNQSCCLELNAVVVVDRINKELLSSHHPRLPPSPADSMAIPDLSPSSSQSELNRITRKIERGAPGDEAIFDQNKSPQQKELAKRKSQYYDGAFAYIRESASSARERISRESMIVADIRTNVIVQDEYAFITEISYSLSARYQRPESSILVTVAHSACLLFGGSFDPAYTMSITALPSQVQPVTNKRNSALIAKAMEDSLGVAPNRGIIKFIPISEENFSTNGKTVAGEIEDLERETAEETSITRGLSVRKNSRRKSTKELKRRKSNVQLPTHNEDLTPPLSACETNPTSPPLPKMPPIPSEKSFNDRKAEKVQRMGRRKSFISTIFGK